MCMIHGKNPFRTEPEWIIDGQPLQISTNITYLGAVLGGNNGQPHCDSRMCSAQRAFYSLQGAGLCYKGVDQKVAINIFQTAVQTTLTYGCSNVFISRTALNSMDSFQAKLLKSILGLGKQSRTTPMLHAMKVAPVSHIVNLQYSTCLYSNSQCGVLYKYMISNIGSSFLSKTLLGRVHKFSQDKNFSVIKY